MADVVRCAIYTRKSSEEGLEQAFNSLAAQRTACAAYITSQKNEGWIDTRAVYDDGGFSGGNLERPALQRLLGDVSAGLVDVIVIYKIDRLTRSLRDFAKLADILDQHGASFVAVTQQFSTTTSMGRLTLNVLLTFAQFEREVAGDRIRDKLSASKRLGIWMGGNPALGYKSVAKKLVIDPDEAFIVREIFKRFLELQSMSELRRELVKRGVVSKRRIMKSGSQYGGVNFTWNPLHKILTNPIYIGMTRHKKMLFQGQHEAIIDKEGFAQVQKLVATLAASERARRIMAYPALLKGLIYDFAGARLYPTHSVKGSRKHYYYVSSALVKRRGNAEARNMMRISGPSLEKFVISRIAGFLRDHDWLISILPNLHALSPAKRSARELATEIEQQCERNTGLIQELLVRAEIDRDTIRLSINRQWLLKRLILRPYKEATPSPKYSVEITIKGHGIKCGMLVKAIIGDQEDVPNPDHRLVREILRAIRWFEALTSGAFATITALARAEGCCPTLISNRIRLAFLAPDIVEAIIAGRQPPGLTIARLKQACPLPLAWHQQRDLLLEGSVLDQQLHSLAVDREVSQNMDSVGARLQA